MVSNDFILDENEDGIFDSSDPDDRNQLDNLNNFPLLDDHGQEIPIFDHVGHKVPRRYPIVDEDAPPCGVLVNLSNIQTLFDPFTSSHDYDDSFTPSSDILDPCYVHIDAYPLAFLKSVGNVQANGVPSCFYPIITKINNSVRKHSPNHHRQWDDDDDDNNDLSALDHSLNDNHIIPSLQAVKPISSQFYNYITHRVATRAGKHDAQQGSVTAAIAGAFADSKKHKRIASEMQSYCNSGLPADRFHSKISLEDCPTSCRAEFVYSIDVRALKHPSGMHVLYFLSFQPFSFILTYLTDLFSVTSSFLLLDPGNPKTFVSPSRTI